MLSRQTRSACFVDIPNTFKNNNNARQTQKHNVSGNQHGYHISGHELSSWNGEVCHFTEILLQYDHVISRDRSHEIKVMVVSFSKHQKFLLYDKNSCHTSHLKTSTFWAHNRMDLGGKAYIMVPIIRWFRGFGPEHIHSAKILDFRGLNCSLGRRVASLTSHWFGEKTAKPTNLSSTQPKR